MRKRLNNLLAKSFLVLGSLATISGIGIMIKDPENIIGYTGTIGGIASIKWGYDQIRQYSKR